MSHGEMRLTNLQLQNFRQFGVLNVDFDDRLTVLVGNNGSGKTSILDAAAIALGTLLMRVDSPYGKIYNLPIEESDMRVRAIKAGTLWNPVPQPPTRIIATGEVRGERCVWMRAVESVKGRTTTRDAHAALEISSAFQQEITDGETKVLPLLAYYGAGRLWAHKKAQREINKFYAKGFSRSSGYIDCLAAETNEKLMLTWFKRMAQVEFEEERRIPELTAVYGAMNRSIERLTGVDHVDIRYRAKAENLVLTIDRGYGTEALPFEQLSDGYRGVVSLFTDIAYRMAVLNPNQDDILATPGVVLIDEIDLHLHPLWQERILDDLQSVFPNIQFIVTTHAPSVIASVKASQLRHITRITPDEAHESEYQNGLDERLRDSLSSDAYEHAYMASGGGVESYGHTADSILEDVMGAHRRPKWLLDRFDAFYRKLDQGDLRQAEEELSAIRELIGSDDDSDSDLVSAQVSLDLEQGADDAEEGAGDAED